MRAACPRTRKLKKTGGVRRPAASGRRKKKKAGAVDRYAWGNNYSRKLQRGPAASAETTAVEITGRLKFVLPSNTGIPRGTPQTTGTKGHVQRKEGLRDGRCCLVSDIKSNKTRML